METLGSITEQSGWPRFSILSRTSGKHRYLFLGTFRRSFQSGAIQSGEVRGFWTQLSRPRFRAWNEAIRPGLDQRAAFEYDVLLGTDISRPGYRLTDESRPSEVAFAAWALLDASDPKQLDILLSHILERTARHHC